MQFDVQLDGIAARRTRQLQQSVATSIEVACRSLLTELLGYAPDVVVEKVDTYKFRVTVTLDSASASADLAEQVELFVKSKSFVDNLFTLLGLPVGHISSVKKFVEAAGAPMPPPPPPSSRTNLIIAILSGAVLLIYAGGVYAAIVFYQHNTRRIIIHVTLPEPTRSPP